MTGLTQQLLRQTLAHPTATPSHEALTLQETLFLQSDPASWALRAFSLLKSEQ